MKLRHIKRNKRVANYIEQEVRRRALAMFEHMAEKFKEGMKNINFIDMENRADLIIDPVSTFRTWDDVFNDYMPPNEYAPDFVGPPREPFFYRKKALGLLDGKFDGDELEGKLVIDDSVLAAADKLLGGRFSEMFKPVKPFTDLEYNPEKHKANPEPEAKPVLQNFSDWMKGEDKNGKN